LRAAVEDVYVDELILQWIVDLVRATREAEGVATGASVRGSLTLERTARARALLHGRDHVVPEDVDALFLPVLRTPLATDRVVRCRDAHARTRRSAAAHQGTLPRTCTAARTGLGQPPRPRGRLVGH